MKSPTSADGLVRALRLAGGGDSFFDFSFTTTAAAPISSIHSVRITAICIRHGSIKEKSGRGNRLGHALIGDIH